MICYLKITGASDAPLNTCTSMGSDSLGRGSKKIFFKSKNLMACEVVMSDVALNNFQKAIN